MLENRAVRAWMADSVWLREISICPDQTGITSRQNSRHSSWNAASAPWCSAHVGQAGVIETGTAAALTRDHLGDAG
jgi:hypothetical protein